MGLLRMAAMRPAVQLKRLVGGNFGQTRYTRYLEKHQFDAPSILKKMQAEKLCILMRHACGRIPFYKHLGKELGLTPETAFSDIKKFPVVTKQMISSDPGAFVDGDIPSVMKMKTGGTSNVKVEVIRDRSSHNLRNDEYFNRMIGLYPGMRRLILSRHESNYRVGNDENPEDFIHYYHNWLSGTYQVKPMPLTWEKLAKIYEFYINGKPEFMRANLNTGYVFARYAEANGLGLPPLKMMRSSSTQMVGEHRETFRRVFGTDPYDAYGASEINFVASQCEKRGGMHYVPMSHYIEILDEDDTEVGAGVPGSIVVTSLVHMAMPIIRYRIGDCAALSDELCSCGRTYPVIREILGRDSEIIRAANGNITGADLLGLIKSHQGIADCQIIERDAGFLVNLVKSNEYTEDDVSAIKEYIGEMAGEADVEISFVPMIPMLPNAKSLRVIPREFDSDIENKLLYFRDLKELR